MAVDALAHITKEVNGLNGTIGEEPPSAGVELAVNDRPYVRVVFIHCLVTRRGEVGVNQRLFNGRSKAQAVVLFSN